MSVVTIQEHGQTAKGTPKIKANGKWYFLARDAGPAPGIGLTVEIREGSFTMGDPPKQFDTIEAWRVPSANPPQTYAQSQQNYSPPPQNSRKPEPEAEYIEEASLRYISNVVGQAIAAKTIQEPGQVLAWFLAAKASLRQQPAPVPFDDRIPH